MALTNLENPPVGSDPWSQLQNGIASSISNYLCSHQVQLYSGAAAAILSNPGSSALIPPALIAATWLWSHCQTGPRPVYPASAFTGGQCSTNYAIQYRNPQSNQWADFFDSGMRGPITNIQEFPTPPNGGSGRFLMTNYTGFTKEYLTPNFGGYNNYLFPYRLIREDGQPDNCGNPAPVPPEAPDTPAPIQNYNITLNFSDGDFTVPISIGPFQPQFNLGPVIIPLYLNGMPINVDVNFDVNIGFPRGAKPVDDRTTEDQNYRADDSDCEEAAEKAQEASNKLDCVVDAVCSPFSWEFIHSFCDTNEEPVIINGNGSGLSGLAELIQVKDDVDNARALDDCPEDTEQENPTQIAQGLSTESSPIFVVSVDDEVKSVSLIIDSYNDARVNLYRLAPNGNEEGKFGAISSGLAQQNGVCTEPKYVWNRKTYLRLIESQKQRIVKISLRPTIQWKLFDTGER